MSRLEREVRPYRSTNHARNFLDCVGLGRDLRWSDAKADEMLSRPMGKPMTLEVRGWPRTTGPGDAFSTDQLLEMVLGMGDVVEGQGLQRGGRILAD